MKEELEKLKKLMDHLIGLFEFFDREDEFKEVSKILQQVNFRMDYILGNRQIVLSDLIEFIIFGRLAYFMQSRPNESNKKLFLEFLLGLINLLMKIDSLSVSENRRKSFIKKLLNEKLYLDEQDRKNLMMLKVWNRPIGMPLKEILNSLRGFQNLKKGNKKKLENFIKELNKVYDSVLPKTAGGLWHELGTYAFMLNLDLGYIIPLLIHQRIFSYSDYLVPPDFLLLTYDSKLYGIEVGGKKEIQSGLFSAKTGIPTITIDTSNSRVSDRCPICKSWIQLCPYVIERFTEPEVKERLLKGKFEIKCLEECNKYKKEEILNGKCPYSKYKQERGKSTYNSHKFADGKHYHWKCVLNNLNSETIEQIKQKGNRAIKTHILYYSGFEGLFKKIILGQEIITLKKKILKIEEIFKKILKGKDDGEGSSAHSS
ncbi:hypothetical protein [Phorcysia thermohydrogeniphila]|uniref:Uncharacterized protein n=1 Tax=Phorcysia thermohydrogeniphila TaxID=936138 RepID=A0A4V6NCZ7_9BACT|nr:hypothetical protein [Phorcysia thermohydrogeniphila]TCK06486.1 hypothetical protein CLV27_0287 [Phorcysia thermohydrogeniphila]